MQSAAHIALAREELYSQDYHEANAAREATLALCGNAPDINTLILKVQANRFPLKESCYGEGCLGKEGCVLQSYLICTCDYRQAVTERAKEIERREDATYPTRESVQRVLEID